jgi:hypothetical protein
MQQTTLTGDIDFDELKALCTDDVDRQINVYGDDLNFPEIIHKTTAARKQINMGGTPLHCKNADGLFRNEEPVSGGYKRRFFLDGVNADCSRTAYPDATVLHQINANFTSIGMGPLGIYGKRFGTLVRQTNSGPSAWSEFNSYGLLDSNSCTEGWVSDNENGANGSQRGTQIESLKIFGAARPFHVAKDIKFYNSRVRGDIGALSGAHGAAQMCVLGDCHGTAFDVGIENGCDIGWYFEHETSATCRVRSSFIHPKSVGSFVVLADEGLRPEWLEISYGQEHDNPRFQAPFDPVTQW